MVNLTRSHLEGLQVVKYEPGDYFKPHHDWFQSDYADKIGNQRRYTFFVYLNDVPGGGGETDFPQLNRSFQPKKGDALFWRNCTELNECSELNLHQGKAPLNDVKYGLNIWVRFYSNSTGG
jgi:prolyl 4-hydroxylase